LDERSLRNAPISKVRLGGEKGGKEKHRGKDSKKNLPKPYSSSKKRGGGNVSNHR